MIFCLSLAVLVLLLPLFTVVRISRHMALLHWNPRGVLAKGLGLFAILIICGGADTQPPTDIGGTGHIEPRGGIIQVGGPGGVTIQSMKGRVGQVGTRG